MDAAARDDLFKAFGRAFFKQDMDAFYDVVTEDFVWTVPDGDTVRKLTSREEVAAFFAERNGKFEDMRFDDVTFHHAPDASFMTCRVSGTEVATGRKFTRFAVERYTFRDGKLAEKDVFNRDAS